MKRPATLCLLALLFGAQSASAHRIDEYLQATILSLKTNSLHASMRMVPGTQVASSVIAAIDRDGNGVFSAGEQQFYAQSVLEDLSITLDGQPLQPHLVSWSVPQPDQLRDGLGEIHIDYTASLPTGSGNRSLVLLNRNMDAPSVYLVNAVVPDDPGLRVLAQRRNPQQTRYELDYQQSAMAAADPWISLSSLRVWFTGLELSSLFYLGIRHIAEGTDHLLFLLTLLLPAPLLVRGNRWGPPAAVRASLLRVLRIVTAFTIGHSLTLTLAAFGALHVPGRPVEVLIAVSIFVSALHALRPIVPGKEALIAGGFGLIHGLAFAATLGRLGLDRGQRLAGILAFNLGIEAMQMLVVAAGLPSLILLSRTRAYPVFRVAGAILAAAASLGWIAERLFGLHTRVDSLVTLIARQSPRIAAALFALAVASTLLRGRRMRRAAFLPEPQPVTLHPTSTLEG